MSEKFLKKQDEMQEKVQNEQKPSDKDCELAEKELEQIVGGDVLWQIVPVQGTPGKGKTYLFEHEN